MADTPTFLKARIQRMSGERRNKVEQLRKFEWEFDRHPTADLARALRGTREQISDLEDKMVKLHARVRLMNDIAALEDEFTIS